MAEGILMPKAGITVESCIITKWYKQKGDKVKVGEALFGYETDKSSFDCESTAEGEILEIFYVDGDEVPVLTNVCAVGNPGDDISALVPAKDSDAEPVAETKAEEPVKEESVPVAAPVAAETTVETVNNSGFVSPRAKALANKNGVDVRLATGSGPHGRVIERDIQDLIDKGIRSTSAAFGDVLNANPGQFVGTGIGGRISVADLSKAPVSNEPELPDFVDEKLSGIRKSISKAMVASLSTMAQLTNTSSFDMTDINAFRAHIKEDAEALGVGKITINDIILWACSRVLPQFPNINANLIDGVTYRKFNNVHLGVAVDTERGLMVPTIFNANKKSLAEIATEAKSLAKQCQSGSINPDLLRGATFTVSNLGSLGVESFTPVINPPQVAILGVNTIVTKIREKNGAISTYQAMPLSLTYDHRVVDGAPAARFAVALTKVLENFTYYLACNGGLK